MCNIKTRMQANTSNYSRNLTTWSHRSVITLCRDWNMVRVSFCAVMQVEMLCFYANLAVNYHSFAVCHTSIIQWSDFNTRTLHSGTIGWTCVAAARIAAAYARTCVELVPDEDGIRNIDHFWHFIRLSVLRFHFGCESSL